MMSLKASPLSRIEHLEALHNMSLSRRLQYMLWFNLFTIIIFAGLCALSITFLLPAIESVIPRRWTLGDHILIVISIIGTFFIAIGITRSELPDQIKPQDTIGKVILRAGWHGLITGFFVGIVFGIIWAFVVRIGMLYAQVNTIYGQTVFLEDLLLYGGLMGVFIAPLFGLFRISTSSLSYGLLSMLKK